MSPALRHGMICARLDPDLHLVVVDDGAFRILQLEAHLQRVLVLDLDPETRLEVGDEMHAGAEVLRIRILVGRQRLGTDRERANDLR